MASLWQKITSGLDFWDQKENQQQRQQYAKEDEEKKRREAARRAVPTPAPTPSVDPNSVRLRVKTEDGYTTPAVTEAQHQQRQNKTSQLEELSQKFMQEQMDREKQRTSWFDRQFTDRNWDKRAESAARNKATRVYQEQNGYNNDPAVKSFNYETGQKLEKAAGGGDSKWLAPVLSTGRVGTGIAEGFSGLYDLVTPGQGTNRVTNALVKKSEEIDQLAKDMNMDGVYKAGNVAGEVASYFTPALIGKAGKVGTGLTKYGVKAADAIGDANKYSRFAQRAATELFDPTNISKEIELTSRYLGQDAARGKDISAGRVAGDIALGVGGAAIPAVVRGLRKAPGSGVDTVLGGNRITGQLDELDNFASRFDDAPSLPGGPSTSLESEVVQIGNGIGSTNLQEPSLSRGVPQTVGEADAQFRLGTTPDEQLFDADRRIIDGNTPQQTFDDGLDRPSFQYNNDVDAVVTKAQNDLNRYREKYPNASPGELAAVARRITAEVENSISVLENARYGQNTATQIPNVADPIALAKAGDAPYTPQTQPNGMMADFGDAVDGSLLRKVDSGPQSVDAYGNESLVSDTAAAQQAVDNGVPLSRGDSPVAAQEAELQAQAEEALRRQAPDLGGAAAPRTRDAVSQKILDDNTRADVLENFNKKETVNFAELEMRAKERVRNLTDQQLVEGYRNQPVIKNPEDLFEAVNTVDRLGRLEPTAENTRALTNAMDAITEFSSESGRRLRAVKELFKDMPAPMRKKFLIDRVEKKLGANLSDADRAELVRRIDASDMYQDQINQIDDVLRKMTNDIELGVPIDEDQARQLISQRKELVVEHEYAQGAAFEYSQQLLPKGTVGKRVSQGIKTAMLSSPLRRLYDPIVTGITQAADTRDSAISGYLGKAINKLTGNRGKFREFKAGDIGTMVKGNLEGAGNSKRALVNNERRIDDMMGELQRATRTDSQGNSKTRVGRFIGDMTEFATEASKGSRDARISQLARQEAAQRGLQGEDAKIWAEITEQIMSSNKLHEASEFHLKTNNLHQNKLNEAISGAQRLIENKFPNAGPILNVMTLPFKSWGSGNITRLLTDKNIVWNIGDIAVNLRKNPQQALDSFGKLAGNTMEAAVVGFGLSKAGVFTDEDDNGETWGGPFINVAGRKVSVAILGPSALPVIAGYNLEQATKDGGFDYERLRIAGEQSLDYSNASSTLAMDNRTSEVLTGTGNLEDRLVKAAGDNLRKPIPSVTTDINAGLNMMPGLNPTGERALTQAEDSEGNKDYIQTEINKTLNRIPFLSQNLAREEGTSSTDLIDRILDSTHSNNSTTTARTQEAKDEEIAQSKEDRDKGYEEAGVPKTEDGIQSAIENGDWDKAIQGVTWELQRKADDGEISEKTKQSYEKQLTRYGVYKDKGASAEMVQAYESTTTEEGGVGVTLWREMMESEDPEMIAYAEDLYRLDTAMVDSGARKERKYDWGKKKSSGGGGGSGSSKIATDIGTVGSSTVFNPSFSPQKASFSSRGNTVPQIAPVPVNDTSMRKKISVKRGGRT